MRGEVACLRHAFLFLVGGGPALCLRVSVGLVGWRVPDTLGDWSYYALHCDIGFVQISGMARGLSFFRENSNCY